MTSLYKFPVPCTHIGAVLHCKKLAAWCSTQWADRYANIPSQCRQHRSSLSPRLSLSSLQAQLQKSISHINQAKVWNLNRPQEHADHPNSLHHPPPPLSWAASAFRNPHPGAQTLPVSHETLRASWLVADGNVTYACHFDSVPADQYVRRKRMQAVK